MNQLTHFTLPVSDLIQKRYSFRTHLPEALDPGSLLELTDFIDQNKTGPFGSQIRALITAAVEGDSSNLKDLGTYGFIKDPAGFLIGVVSDSPHALEDFGYLMELYILKATDLGIGTCWLGGTFTKSRFSKAANLEDGEAIPSVISLGYPANEQAWIDRAARVYAGADRRLPWSDLFFENSLDQPLTRSESGDFQLILDMVRLAPSASNKQPWRIIKDGTDWHFYLQRTKRYLPPVINLLLGIADLQRIDLGIAMAHFFLTALEKGKTGEWILEQPDSREMNTLLEYTATWREKP